MSITRRKFISAATLASQWAACSSAHTANETGTVAAPPLLTSEADWSSLSGRRKADPDLDRLVTTLLERARKDVALPLLVRKLEGRRLLGVSREFIRRSLQWAFAFKVAGDPVYLQRAREEMLAVAAFSDWHPDHYLDAAEMTAGMAMAYHWLFDDLSAGERDVLRDAIVKKGIAQARHGHKTYKSANNWNQVCIGGMALGALAVEKEQHALATDLLAAAQKDVFIGLQAYQPDGVYPEGPGYWDYGTCYSVLLIAALRSAKMGDWGILNSPGFKQSAEFFSHAIGPSGKTFNFADGGEGPGFPCAMVYLARELGQPELLSFMRQLIRNNRGLADRFVPLSALWWPTETGGRLAPTQFSGQGAQPVAIWRSSWTDQNSLWFAIKGGGAAHNHAHMDAGSFVLDMDGVRWAKDLGNQDYNSLESRGIDLWNMKQDSQRWQVFRLSAEAHNTITLDGRPHSAGGMAALRMLGGREALIDITPALLPGQVRQATRRVHFMDDAVQLDDEINGARSGATVRWAMVTDADVRIVGSSAELTQKGKRLTVQFDGAGVQLEVVDISAPRHDYDAPNLNARQLIASGKVRPDGVWKLGVRFARS